MPLHGLLRLQSKLTATGVADEPRTPTYLTSLMLMLELPPGQPPPLGTPAAEGAVPCAIGKGIDADREARGAGVLVTNRVGDWERSRLLVLGRAWLRSDSMVDWLVQWGLGSH